MIKNSLRSVAVALALIALSLGTIGAGDQSARFEKLGHNLMCMCGCNQILLECNHVGCTYSDKMRVSLAGMLESGTNDDLIYQGFVQEYGDTVIAAPPTKGFGRVAWITPFVVLFAGLFGASVVAKRWSADEHANAAAASAANNDHSLDEFRRKARQETEL